MSILSCGVELGVHIITWSATASILLRGVELGVHMFTQGGAGCSCFYVEWNWVSILSRGDEAECPCNHMVVGLGYI